MDNYLLEIINKTTEYIEANILEPLNLDNISENVNISKFNSSQQQYRIYFFKILFWM